MKIEDYENIVKFIRNHRGLTRDCARKLVAKYSNFQPSTLYSILNKEIQLQMKIIHSEVFAKGRNYYTNYLEAVGRNEPVGILLRLATQFKICPALFARKVLEDYVKIHDKNNPNSKSLNKFLKDTSLIKDRNLAYEVYMCVLYDDQYGPIKNAISDCVGIEYEMKLEECLKERNIPYSNEDHLRLKGYDKTPDCKLEVPIAVNGFVVNWIESKAQFGNKETHNIYIKEQFLSYWNRFGPGLVIYWFGYLDDIIQTKETRFIVMDHFPENITYMDPTSLMTSLK
ncbi:protein C15orf41 homolog [Nasonia vitripennis]|uniref:CDAN1-interacting nuclease 1 n=1 Tax=Nasonia vitripennis TaxID=7425 RepID=A0A7M7QY96_NASVI|nr:protein C15orf41 homolog [Nasonia vitripennis]XP_032455475.1 protein C15orf41 homolog [Nasonia vitripennis]XP_032455476.1 protein C15orf41 homolog [Nasonia vitripennis]